MNYNIQTLEKLIKNIQWFDLPARLKAIITKLYSSGVQSVTGTAVNNADPLNPIVNIQPIEFKIPTVLIANLPPGQIGLIRFVSNGKTPVYLAPVGDTATAMAMVFYDGTIWRYC